MKESDDALVNGVGVYATNPLTAIEESCVKHVTDEYILATVITEARGQSLPTIQDGDVAICFNFRTDRCRDIMYVLTQADMHEFNMHKLNLHYTAMTEYDKSLKNVHVIFETDNLIHTLGEVIATNGLKQIRIA